MAPSVAESIVVERAGATIAVKRYSRSEQMAEVTHAPELQEQPATLRMTYEEYLAAVEITG